ncbi:MAG: hypothetical protein FJ150_02920 [Euryarchaeota archaeon]|nr:hypothetical protein [Euryarchaeota archaeon]
MLDPRLYSQQISEVGIEGMEINESSLAEAVSTLIKLKKSHKLLQQIRYNMRMDMRTIRKEYLDQIQAINDSSKKVGMFNKQLIRQKKIDANKVLITKRDEKLAPYEILERLVDDYIIQISDAVNRIEFFIKKQTEEN